MGARAKPSRVLRTYASLQDIMLDKDLAKLGDAYVNFLYSLALSKKQKEATGTKVQGRLLADAFKKAGLREFLSSRIDRHKQADAAEDQWTARARGSQPPSISTVSRSAGLE